MKMRSIHFIFLILVSIFSWSAFSPITAQPVFGGKAYGFLGSSRFNSSPKPCRFVLVSLFDGESNPVLLRDATQARILIIDSQSANDGSRTFEFPYIIRGVIGKGYGVKGMGASIGKNGHVYSIYNLAINSLERGEDKGLFAFHLDSSKLRSASETLFSPPKKSLYNGILMPIRTKGLQTRLEDEFNTVAHESWRELPADIAEMAKNPK
ncbi:MAG: hypothetical protein J0L93_09180 [Deltaproteobacteria bacterium]|nr:hypothetical protein [Deltaproteobacteria bacterium]